MFPDPFRLTDGEIDRLIGEDLPFGDLTTRALGIGAVPGHMSFRARDDLVVAGIEEAARLIERLGAAVTGTASPGQWAPAGTLLLEATGPAASLHAGWKLAQTLMEWAGGIATATRGIVTAARAVSPGIPVLCTRKTVPFSRKLAHKAVLAGGGDVHRAGLSETIMLFPEHRIFLAGPADWPAMIADLRWRLPERSIMIEVNSVEEALAAARARADVIQMEKFPPGDVARVRAAMVRRDDGRPVLAAAGGVNAGNAAAYAAAGADTLVTSAPFAAPPRDIAVSLLRQNPTSD